MVRPSDEAPAAMAASLELCTLIKAGTVKLPDHP
jgi:hypothetical protein